MAVLKNLEVGMYQIVCNAEGYNALTQHIEILKGKPYLFNAVMVFASEAPQNIPEIKAKLDDVPPPDFLPVDKQPIPIKNPAPEYPEIARRAGVEGTVWVKIWVDKEGNAKKAQVIESDAELFNQNAIDAALQWTFTPAIMKNATVDVWVSFPFKFKLDQAK